MTMAPDAYQRPVFHPAPNNPAQEVIDCTPHRRCSGPAATACHLLLLVCSLQGANAPLSGLVAVLGALHALKAAVPASSSFTKRIMFLLLAGEPWAYMGSRRLLYEASTGSNATAGLDLSLVEKVRSGPCAGLCSLWTCVPEAHGRAKETHAVVCCCRSLRLVKWVPCSQPRPAVHR